jgi:predicted acyltransferase
MVGMILVDNSGPYPPWFLDHAEWNGLTPADLIFPSFLFIMGMAIPLAVSDNKPLKPKNIIRVFALFAIGVFLNLLARKFTFNHCKYLFIKIQLEYWESSKESVFVMEAFCSFIFSPNMET